ncbi:MAG: FAD-binding protein, partial [Syntrophales bacterium]
MIPAVMQAELKSIWGDRVLFNEPMERHTSMGVGGSADALIFPQTLRDLREVIDFMRSREVPYLPLGNGTNLIVRDGGYRGVIISLERMNGFRFRDEERNAFMITAEAGFDLAELVKKAAEASLAGVEFLAGIPGTLGGAIRMNAGAYGHEISEIVRTIYLVNGKADLVTLGRGDLRFRYRGLDLPSGSVIAGADLELRRDSEKDIRRRMEGILEQRKRKHPLGIRSAGSIFKNPPG